MRSLPEQIIRLKEADYRQTSKCAPPFTISALPGPDTEITVLDLFSGLGNGLAGAVRSGDIRVGSYRACEKNPQTRAAAMHNLSLVSKAHPDLLPQSVLDDPGVFSMPQDVRAVLTEHLCASGVMDAQHLLVFGTWECQARSMGGNQRGVRDHRHALVRHLHRILSLIQKHRLCKGLSPANVFLENVVVSPTYASPLVLADQQVVDRLFGRAVVADSARFGSRARRVRMYWCNFIPLVCLNGWSTPIIARRACWRRTSLIRVGILAQRAGRRPGWTLQASLASTPATKRGSLLWSFPRWFPIRAPTLTAPLIAMACWSCHLGKLARLLGGLTH